jgi:hypothetical protein
MRPLDQARRFWFVEGHREALLPDYWAYLRRIMAELPRNWHESALFDFGYPKNWRFETVRAQTLQTSSSPTTGPRRKAHDPIEIDI